MSKKKMMKNRRSAAIAGVGLAVALVVGGAALAVRSGDDTVDDHGGDRASGVSDQAQPASTYPSGPARKPDRVGARLDPDLDDHEGVARRCGAQMAPEIASVDLRGATVLLTAQSEDLKAALLEQDGLPYQCTWLTAAQENRSYRAPLVNRTLTPSNGAPGDFYEAFPLPGAEDVDVDEFPRPTFLVASGTAVDESVVEVEWVTGHGAVFTATVVDGAYLLVGSDLGTDLDTDGVIRLLGSDGQVLEESPAISRGLQDNRFLNASRE